MDYDPKRMLITCLFLATKVENNHMALEDFLRKIPKAPADHEVVEYEFALCQGLRFEFMLHHPFWPLHGFFLDMQTYIQQGASSKEKLQESFKKLVQCYSKAREWAFTSLYTDLHFTMWPSQVAMACLFLAAKELNFAEDLNAVIISVANYLVSSTTLTSKN